MLIITYNFDNMSQFVEKLLINANKKIFLPKTDDID